MTTTTDLTAAFLEDAAMDYFNQGWLAIPLTLDGQGFPKRPIPEKWTSIPYSWEAIQDLPWSRASGLGIVLGSVSGNLAAIDVDDEQLADAAFTLLKAAKFPARMICTVRQRLHIYVQEQTASPSISIPATWRGRRSRVELKGIGTQVAAPPTEGYTVVHDVAPWSVPTIHQAWDYLQSALHIESDGGKPGYPAPWQDDVGAGDRNNAAYVEAHRLREAGMSLAQALQYMRVRFDASYEPGGIAWTEIERTIQSAYRKTARLPLWKQYGGEFEI